MTRNHFIAIMLLAALALVAAPGCKPKEAVVPVSGVATYKGAPLAYCSIFFTPSPSQASHLPPRTLKEKRPGP